MKYPKWWLMRQFMSIGHWVWGCTKGFRVDIIVEGKVVLELKSVEPIVASHRKQIQTYPRLTDLKLGFLLNFGAALMKDGIVRAVNGLEE